MNGDLAEGISLLRSGSTASRATGAELWMPYYTALLARACVLAGQIEEAVVHLNNAFQTAERTGECWFAAELHRHKGQLLLREGHPKAAEGLYRQALTIAQEQEAKLWELRAATTAQGFAHWGAQGTIYRGWAKAAPSHFSDPACRSPR